MSKFTEISNCLKQLWRIVPTPKRPPDPDPTGLQINKVYVLDGHKMRLCYVNMGKLRITFQYLGRETKS